MIPGLLDEEACSDIGFRLQTLDKTGAGTRTLLDHSWCAELASSLRDHPLLTELLPVDAVPVQCTFFDKTPVNNWLVSWHQDLSIPVKERVDHPSCGAWSEKEGRLYTQPPAAVIDTLLVVRIHVDDCPAESGALRVVPGLHAGGRLSTTEAEKLRRLRGERTVPASRGDALMMRPMILHASSKATQPVARRVLHLVYGCRRQ